MPTTGSSATVPTAGSTTAANADATTTHARAAQDTATTTAEAASTTAETAAAHMATHVPATHVCAATAVAVLGVTWGSTGKRQGNCKKGRCAEDFQFHFVLLYVRHIQSVGPVFVPLERLSMMSQVVGTAVYVR
jgi:hypothetical protein